VHSHEVHLVDEGLQVIREYVVIVLLPTTLMGDVCDVRRHRVLAVQALPVKERRHRLQ